jgi:uncharacterized membrane protein YqgA involved in biofilm formation
VKHAGGFAWNNAAKRGTGMLETLNSLGGILLGTVVNGAAIAAGGLLGALLGDRIPSRYKTIVMQAIGLAVTLIGIQMALGCLNLLALIFGLVIGGLAGEAIGIDAWLRRVGAWVEKKAARNGSGLASAFVFATLIYCVGAMAVTGALESGLLGRHQILFAKSVLDGVTAIAFAATMGAGISLAAVPVVMYQGGIALAAGTVRPLLSPAVIAELSAVGGVLILAIGLNLLELKEMKVANLLPALLVVLVWMILAGA